MKLLFCTIVAVCLLKIFAQKDAGDGTIDWDYIYQKGDVEYAHNIWERTGQTEFGNFIYRGNPMIDGWANPEMVQHAVPPPRFENQAWDCQTIDEWDPMTNFVLKMADKIEAHGGDCARPYQKDGDRKKSTKIFENEYGRVYLHGWAGRFTCEQLANQLRVLTDNCHKELIGPYDSFRKMRNRTGGVIYLDANPMTYTWLSVATHDVT